MNEMEQKVILALDVISLTEVDALIEVFSPRISIYKVGARLFSAVGPDAMKRIIRMGNKCFFDLKLHDIPSTVADSVIEATHLGVHFLNLHALGGFQMMSESAKKAKEKAAIWNVEPPKLLGVTILTSTTQAELDKIGINKPVKQMVIDLARLAQDAGLDGVVASPWEIGDIKSSCGKNFLVVTPGVRPTWADQNDQMRVATPKEALDAGADYIVIGRPLRNAPNQQEALDKLFD